MPTFVQGAQSPDTNDGTDTTCVIDPFLSNPTAGDCIVAHFSAQTSGTLASVADNATGGSNVWTVIDSLLIDAPNGIRLFTAIAQDIKSGASPLTVTGTFSLGAQFRRGCASQFTGAATTGQPHKNSINSSATFGTGTDACTSGAQTTTIDGCTIYGVVYDDSTATLPSAGTSFNSRGTGTFGAGDCWRVEERLQATQGSVAATFTTSAGTDTIGVAMLALAPTAGNPTINTQPQSATVYQGQTANFTIAATTSGGTLHYQWKDDGSNVGTDSNSYTTAATVLSDSGSLITCVVTDDNGNTTSQAAILTVIPTATIAWISA